MHLTLRIWRQKRAQEKGRLVTYTLDDGPWRAVTPAGGFTDQRTHAFDVRLERVQRGGHAVSVRVVDLAGNAATRAERVTVVAGPAR